MFNWNLLFIIILLVICVFYFSIIYSINRSIKTNVEKSLLNELMTTIGERLLMIVRPLLFIVIGLNVFVMLKNYLDFELPTLMDAHNLLNDFQVLTGAFLAGVIGILTQLFLRNLNEKKEIRKNSRILYNDLSSVLTRVDNMKVASSDRFEANVPQSYFKKISILKEWRNHYSYLTQILSEAHYNKISFIYESMQNLNHELEEKNIENVQKFSHEITSQEINFNLSGHLTLSNKELLEDLERLSFNKKVKDRTLSKILTEIIYIFIFKKHYLTNTENEVMMLMRNEGRMGFNEVVEKMETHYKQNKEKYPKQYDRFLKRLVSDAVNESQVINYVWGECWLSEDDADNDLPG